ncbi:hypothetical protein [Devosia aquimaris]|uniref:hypothetical protein n=1 Tax=Devosia aquimaris TaxID=2866214 RepID=UPI001CD12AFD|nr:hypothetical protein [Devosia sp. CJK-A8-3]
MANFGWDLAIIAALGLFGIVCFKLAYGLGAPVWPKQFATRLPTLPWLSSGEVGELANLGLIAAILLVLLVLTPDANLLDLIRLNWVDALAVVLIVTAGVTLYSVIAVRKVRRANFRPGIKKTEHNLRLLARGYRFYIGYGAAISLLIMAIFGITVHQIFIDYDRFQLVSTKVDAILQELRGMDDAAGSALQTRFEVLFGTQRVAEGYILDQVNSLLMLLLCVMLAYSIVYGTSIRQVFAEEALHVLRIIVAILVAVCLIYGCAIFFTLHINFVDNLLGQLGLYESRMNQGPWDVTQRYHELIAELSRQRGIFGFLVALTTGRGGLILVTPVAGYFLQSMLSGRGNQQPSPNTGTK